MPSNPLDVDYTLVVGDGTYAVTIDWNSNDTAITVGNYLTLNDSVTWQKSTTATLTFDTVANDPVQWNDNNSGSKQDLGIVSINGAKEVDVMTSVTATSVNVTTGNILDLQSSGNTLTITGSGIDASRPFIVADAGGLTEGTNSLVAYTGTGNTDIEAETYHDLTLAPSGGSGPTYELPSTTITTEDLTIGDGTYAVTIDWNSQDTTINVGGHLTLKDSASWTKSTTATLTFIAGSTSPATWKDENTDTKEDLGIVSLGADKEIDLGSSVTATSVNITGSDTLDLQSSGYTLTITGSGEDASRPFINSGTLTEGTNSTVKYTGGSTTDIEVETYYNLSIHPSAAVTHYLVAGTTEITNDLDLGDSSNSGTIDANSHGATVDVNGSMTINANATYDADNANNLTVAKNFTNAGTFNHNSGPVVFDTTNTTIIDNPTGGTIFYGFNVSTDTKIVQFDNADKTEIATGGTFSIQGTDCTTNRVFLTTDSGVLIWELDVNTGVTVDIDYADIGYSNAVDQQVIAANSTEDNGNNTNWDIDLGTCGVILQGNLFQDEGSTAIDCTDGGGDRTVQIRVNGAGSYSDICNTADGAWNRSVTASANDVITVYIDDESEEATTVFVTDGVTKDDVNLFQNRVIVRHDTGSSITNDNLYDGDDNDDDIKYIVDAETNGNLTVDSNFELHIWDGDSFAPGGNVTTQGTGSLHIDDNATFSGGTTQDHVIANDVNIDASATLTAPSTEDNGTITVSGSWTNDAAGIFDDGTGEVIFNGSGTEGITTATDLFYDLTFNGVGTFTLNDALTVDEEITITQGTVNTSNDVTVGSNSIIDSGSLTVADTHTFNQTAGTTILRSEDDSTGATIGGAGSTTFYDLYIGAATPDNTTYTFTTAGDLTVSNTLIIQDAGASDNHILDVSDDTITLSGSTDPFTVDSNAQFDESTSIVKYIGTSATNVTAEIYYNLYLHPGAAVTHSLASGTVQVDNDLEVGDGTFASTITADPNDTTVDVNGNMTINANGTYTADDTNALTIAKNFTNAGTFTHNNGRVTFDTTNDAIIDNPSGGTIFYEFYVATGSKTVKFDNADKTEIATGGTFSIQGSDCTTNRIFLTTDSGVLIWELDVNTGVTVDIDYADIGYSDAVDQTVSAENSTQNNNGNTNWSISGDDCVINSHATTELYDPDANTFAATGSLNTKRAYHASLKLTNGKVLALGGRYDESFYLSSAELYDPATATWTNAGNLNTARSHFSARLISKNRVLVTGGYNGSVYLSSSEVFELNDNWVETGDLNSDRTYHRATLLKDGRVLVSAGWDYSDFVSNSEIYDPSTGTWTYTDYGLKGRHLHTSTLLNDGRVLAAGGGGGGGGGARSSSQLFYPSIEFWADTGSLNTRRQEHAAILLNNGKVLAAGGTTGSDKHSSSELYDNGTWTSTGNLSEDRVAHTATLLNNGLVLAAGGSGDSVLSSSELYDPSTEEWSETGSMNTARFYQSATLLNNGQVLVSGGIDAAVKGLSSAELYDPSTGTWSSIDNLKTARNYHTTTLLNNGQVLVSGGHQSGVGIYHSSSELYDPFTGTWALISNLSTARSSHAAVLLNNGQVLVVGGDSGPYSSSELFIPNGERPVSVDHSNQGGQQHPQIAMTDEDNGVIVWQDDLNNEAPAYFGDSNGDWDGNQRILMQMIENDNGIQQWPVSSKPLDIRVDSKTSYTGDWSNDQFTRGKPAMVHWTDASNNRYLQTVWQDDRNTNVYSPHDIYGQKYDTYRYTIGSGDWTVYYHVSSDYSSGTVDVNVSVMEWDGQEKVADETSQNSDPTGGQENSVTFSSPPISDDLTMRRLRVTFDYNSGSVPIEFGSSAADSRLATGTVIPERNLSFLLLALFMPKIIQGWYIKGKRRKYAQAKL